MPGSAVRRDGGGSAADGFSQSSGDAVFQSGEEDGCAGDVEFIELEIKSDNSYDVAEMGRSMQRPYFCVGRRIGWRGLKPVLLQAVVFFQDGAEAVVR